MKKLDKIPTSDVLAYMNILENLHMSTTQAINGFSHLIAQNDVSESEVVDIMSPLKKINKEQKEMFDCLQKEVDRRMIAQLGFEQGTRRSQYLYDKMMNFLEKKQRESDAKSAEIHDNVRKLRSENDQNNSTQN